ncbi:D-arabinono-1,4-lactone oxidase [Microbacterium aurantiacum]|uniref:D-arabinono-1,4-lactone oxidase n=1 Tax=Microbacterium aurantiacum TaxID=162393 RepID=UPI001F458C42|nr:D-arabinono-1,4-lactone oxidase [Microbacterium aurantiacum]
MTRPGGRWQNWGRTEQVRPRRVERPPSVDAVRRAVDAAARRGLRVKAVGAGHSFSAIALAPDILLDLDELSGLVDVDRGRGLATFAAGTRLHRIPALLAPYGLAMENLGDIDRQSLAGAISTGTHGTGIRFGGLGSQVAGMTLVTADGERVTITEEDGELLDAVAVSLGALGVIVEVTLRCVPAFVLAAQERPEPLQEVCDDLAGRSERDDHFEFYWFPGTDLALTKSQQRHPADTPTRPLSAGARFLEDVVVGGVLHRAACATGALLPASVPSLNRVSTRAWGGRDFSDASAAVFATRRSVRFAEMEYAVPIERLVPAFEAVRDLIRRRGWRISFPIEVRTAAADAAWMSTSHGRESGYIAVHRYWREDPGAYFDAVEEILLAEGGRPHWGKMHAQDAAVLASRYPRFADFVAVRDQWDPHRVFANPYIERVLGG